MEGGRERRGKGRGALRVHLILGGGKEQHPEHHDEPAGAQQRDRRVHVLAVQWLVRVERDEVERATLGGKLLEVGERRPREHRRAVAEELVEERGVRRLDLDAGHLSVSGQRLEHRR